MNKKSQRGFAHLGLALILLIIVIVGASGYLVYRNNKKGVPPTKTNIDSDQSTTEITNNETSKTNEDTAPKYNNLYEDKVGRFTVNYPDNWTLEKRNDLGAGESEALLKEKSGISILLSSGMGGYGFESTCDFEEATGRVIWTGDEGRQDPCPYKFYHNYKKLMTTAKVGGAQKSLHVVKMSYGDEKDRTYFVTVTTDNFETNKKIYGVDVPMLRGIYADDRDRVVARVEPSGSDISYFDKEAVKEAFSILETFKFY